MDWRALIRESNAKPLLHNKTKKECLQEIGSGGAVVALSTRVYSKSPHHREVANTLLIGLFSPDIDSLLLLRQLHTGPSQYDVYAIDRLFLIPFVEGGVF